MCSYLRNYVLQPTKYANAALSRDKVLAMPPQQLCGTRCQVIVNCGAQAGFAIHLNCHTYFRFRDKAPCSV